jgi:hypothetical protein
VTKLNLLINGGDLRSGYVNIDPLAVGQDEVMAGSVGNLDWIADDAECDEIVALDVIDFLSSTETDATLEHWLKKLRHGGTITIGGIDLYEVAKGILHGRIDVAEANFLIHGNQSVPADCRKANTTIQQMIRVLDGLGYELLHKKIDGYKFYITARRP